MTGSPRQTGLGRILFAPLRWLWIAISVAVPFVTFLFLFGLVAVELIPLGSQFGLLLVVVPFIALMVTVLIKVLPALIPLRRRRAGISSREQAAIFGLLALVIIAAALITPTTIERLSRNEDAKAAIRHFAIEHDPGVELGSLERTLAEFERARRRMSEEWTVQPDAPPISLEILQDMETYRQIRHEDWSTGFAICRERGIVIVVPVEGESGVMNEYDRSDTPRHEMVHGMMCQILGQEAYFSIQLWYHEGLAQLYQNDKLTNLFDRVFNRLDVWLNRDRLPSPERFCDYRLDGSDPDVRLFYQTSWEFVRSLESARGRADLNAIVTDVAAGDTFERSMERRLGGVCADLYAEWREIL